MIRRLALLAATAGALVLAPVAAGAYPAPFAAQGGTGVLSDDGALRFNAERSGTNTLLTAERTKDGTVVRSRTVEGAFGIPVLTQSGYAGGLSHDGSMLVLQNMGLATTSRFLVVGTRDLAVRDSITLHGTFGFDALSPDGSKLYLIQHKTANDIEHYVVRAYDLVDHALLPGRVADKTQKSWVMQGWAISRASTSNGRWAYTLYANPGGYPFIHALDTMRGVAHCIGLPWEEPQQDPVYQFTLAVHPRFVAVKAEDGRTWRLVNRASWRVSTP
jgi:hypothetical protein